MTIDVGKLHGGAYATTYEDRIFKATRNLDHKMIRCEQGSICTYNDDQGASAMLLACTNNPKWGRDSAATKKIRKLADANGWLITQDGDDGINVAFPVLDLSKVAAVMKPKLRQK